MPICEKLANCAFVGCCEQFEKSTAAKGFISMYCKGSKMDACIRKKLANNFGKEIVPSNMMPNGAPLPGTDQNSWDEKALHFRRYV